MREKRRASCSPCRFASEVGELICVRAGGGPVLRLLGHRV